MSRPTIRMIAIMLSHGQPVASHEMVDPSRVFADLSDIVWC